MSKAPKNRRSARPYILTGLAVLVAGALCGRLWYLLGREHERPQIRWITLTNDGNILFDSTPVSLSELEHRLNELKALNPNTPVVVRGSAGTQYRTVVDIHGVLERTSLSNVGLATSPAME